MTSAVNDLGRHHGLELGVRVGIHTGPAVVDSVGDRPEWLALGDTPNLAARVQEAAEPGTVLISDVTYRLTRGYFNSLSIGQRLLKGFPDPVALHRVVDETGAATRLEASALGGLSPLVGRVEECVRVAQAWTLAKSGKAQVLLLEGEPGIGKSRQVAELKEALRAEPHNFIECRCAPHHQTTPFHPIADLLERRLGLRNAMPAPAAWSAIERELATRALITPDAPKLLAWLLRVPLPEGQSPLEMTPKQRRDAVFELLVSWILDFSRKQPTVVVLEDLHWADPSTLDLPGILWARSSGQPLLVLLTARPEFQAPWRDTIPSDKIVLGRLGRDHMTTLVSGLTGNKHLPATLVAPLLARADGVPLFVEEMTKAVLESGALRETEEGYEAAEQVSADTIPETLLDSLTARLDRLGSAKQVAQLAAVLGREFEFRILTAIAATPEATLSFDLQRLIDAQLLYRSEEAGSSYVFKHALIQEAAYQSLLRRKRQEYHLRVAAALKDEFSELASRRPELLAHHYACGGMAPQAVEYWQTAGHQAIESSAHVEAIGHFASALEQLNTLPSGRDRAKTEMTLRSGLGLALLTTKGFAAQEVEETYRRAAELCEELGDELPLRLVYGSWAVNLLRADPVPVARLVKRFRVLESASDLQTSLVSLASLQTWTFWRGDYLESLRLGERAMALCDESNAKGQHEALLRNAGFEGLFYPTVYCAWTQVLLGELEVGQRLWERARQLALTVGDPYALAGVESVGISIKCLLGQLTSVRESSESLHALAAEKGFIYWQAAAMIPRGQAMVLAGQAEAGLQELKSGLGILQAMGALLVYPFFLSSLCEAYLGAGRLAEAMSSCEEALAMTRANEFRHGEPNLLRLMGLILARQGNLAGARLRLEESLDLSRAQGAKFLELQAATSLVQLHEQAASSGQMVPPATA